MDRKTIETFPWNQIEMAKELYNEIKPPARKAIDARLVKSASKPMSNKERRKLKRKRETPEGKGDKNGNPLKFTRDIESDWSFPGGIRNALCLCN